MEDWTNDEDEMLAISRAWGGTRNRDEGRTKDWTRALAEGCGCGLGCLWLVMDGWEGGWR